MPTNNAWNSQDPAQVAKGGTGIATTTAYAPICGGTSSTGALQAATTGLSTSGYVLTSNGASALPSFQSPASCAFSAWLSADATDVTGDGSAYFLIADTEIFDLGSNYNNSTGVFTAPATGYYYLATSFTLHTADTNQTQMRILFYKNGSSQISQGFVELNPQPLITSGNKWATFNSFVAIALNSTDTMQVLIQVNDGAKNADIVGGSSTSYPAACFWGYKIA
jgi:hypothetical protein